MNNMVKSTNNEFFSVATQFYVRLRRVTGRVVDAVHMAENKEYTKHVIQLALSIDDAELQKHALRLDTLIKQDESQTELTVIQNQTQDMELQQNDPESLDKIYKAEVSHHYIGALR